VGNGARLPVNPGVRLLRALTIDLAVENADKDVEARAALWKAICVASDDVRYRFRVDSIRGIGGVEVHCGAAVPEVPTWRLVEALNLLGAIIRSEDATADVINYICAIWHKYSLG
jgi:hypothetical protein